MREHLDFGDLDAVETVRRYQKLSSKFRKEFGFNRVKDNWLYKSKRKKLEYIKKNTDYEIIDDYVIAYKAVKSDNYSVYNFQYRYEAGGIYESNCDCNLVKDNSFGLSAWDLEGAREYYDLGKILRVRIRVGDVGAITRGGKIRSYRMEVMEEI